MQQKITEQTLVNEQRLLACDFFQNSNKLGLLSVFQYLDFVNHLVKSNQVKYLLVPKNTCEIYQKIYFNKFHFFSFDNNLVSSLGMALRLQRQKETLFLFVEKNKNIEKELKQVLQTTENFGGLSIVIFLIDAVKQTKQLPLSKLFIKSLKKLGYLHKSYTFKAFNKKFLSNWMRYKRKHKSKNALMIAELDGLYGQGTAFVDVKNLDLSFFSFAERFNMEERLGVENHFGVPQKHLIKDLQNIKPQSLLEPNSVWKKAVANFGSQFLLHYENLQVFSKVPTTLQVNPIIINQDSSFILSVMRGFNFDDNFVCLFEAEKHQNINLPIVTNNTQIEELKQYNGYYFIKK